VKNKAIAAFVLAYVLLGSVYSVTPAFADSHLSPIELILNDSKQGIEDKFAEFEANGLDIPTAADSLYDDGVVKYLEALDFLNSGDFENANDPGLKALDLFEDAYEVLLEAEEELVIEQEGYVGDILAIAESIINLKNDADELRDLISINNLDISLDDLYVTISMAEDELFAENVSEAEALINSAEDILDEKLKQIEYKAEEEQDERVSEFVEDLISDLEDAIDLAIELNFDEATITQLQNLLDELTGYDIETFWELTGEGNDNEEVVSTSTASLPDKDELEAELVDNEGEENGEAEFKQREDRKKLSVEIEDQTPDTTFDVLVDGVSVGQITTDEDGEGELELDSRDEDPVPSVMDDDIVDIIEMIDGADVIVLSGTFSLEGHDDDAKEDNEEDEIELKGTLTDNGDGSFDLETEDGVLTILTDDETEIDDGLELMKLKLMPLKLMMVYLQQR